MFKLCYLGHHIEIYRQLSNAFFSAVKLKETSQSNSALMQIHYSQRYMLDRITELRGLN